MTSQDYIKVEHIRTWLLSSMSLNQWNLKSAQKERQFPSFFDQKNWLFYRNYRFRINSRKACETQQENNGLCCNNEYRLDLPIFSFSKSWPSFEKKQWNTAYFFIKCSKPCRKKWKNHVATHKKPGTDKLDIEKNYCANTFPRVWKQTLLFEVGVCIGYPSF